MEYTGQERRLNSQTYQCHHEGVINRLENDIDNVEKRLEEGAKKFEMLLVKLEQMTAQVPVIHEKQDQYKRDAEKIFDKLEQIESRFVTRTEAVEKEQALAMKVLEEKLSDRIQSSIVRVHDRQDSVQKEMKAWDKKFNYGLAFGIGLWVAVGAYWNVYDPIGTLKEASKRLAFLEKEMEEQKSWNMKQDMNTNIGRRSDR
jgi:chromosome segregation ATPase